LGSADARAAPAVTVSKATRHVTASEFFILFPSDREADRAVDVSSKLRPADAAKACARPPKLCKDRGTRCRRSPEQRSARLYSIIRHGATCAAAWRDAGTRRAGAEFSMLWG
jgi:hypothetical protein